MIGFSKKQLIWAAAGAAALFYLWKKSQAQDTTASQSASQAPIINNMGGTDFGTTSGDW